MDNGAAGITAVKPAVVGDKCITRAEKLPLKNNQRIALCDEDMSIRVEYEIQFAIQSAAPSVIH